MLTKESIGIIPSGVADAKGNSAVLQTRRDEMANAKEFDAGNGVAIRALKCTNKPRPIPSPCIIPPKCGPIAPRPNRG